MRSIQSNKLYHTLATQLYRMQSVKIYDGRFTTLGYPNPVVIRLSAFSYDTARELLKALDLEYPTYQEDTKEEIFGLKYIAKKGSPLSSAKLTTEQMNSHITFLEILTKE